MPRSTKKLRTLTAWRIVKARYQSSAFDGEGGRQYGGRWTSPGLPSAIIESESNYLLNPHHPDFTSVVVSEPQPFRFDVRLVQP